MSAIPPLNDNFRARPHTYVRQRAAYEHPAPFFRGLAWGFAIEIIGIALIFGAAYLWWAILP